MRRNREVDMELHSSSNIIQLIKSRRLRLVNHVARKERGEVHTGFWWGNLKEGYHLKVPCINRRIILK
jgi:hypothetical protein